MATKRTITVAIEESLLNRVHAIAARRGLSISGLLADRLQALVADDHSYESTRRRASALLCDGFALGGARIIDRESLHERLSAC